MRIACGAFVSGTTTAAAVVLAIVSGAAAPIGCSSTPVVLPSRDLDRPTDMAFTCMGVTTDADGIATLAGAPMGKCHPSGIQDLKTGTLDPSTTITDPNTMMAIPNVGTQYRTYAFVTNSDRGDLSVIDMSFCRPGDNVCFPPGAALIDLDPDLVGYAAAPLGVRPEVVAASQDGCRVVSANRGSCDLTLVNPSVLLTPHVVPAAHRGPNTPDINTFATTVVPRTDSGPLNLAPGEIAFLPQQTGNLPEGQQATAEQPTPTYCDANGTFAAPVGTTAAIAASVPWRAIVTFPSCDLIAMIDLPSGNVIDSWQVGKTVDSNGVELGYSFVPSGTNPVCPVVDCTASGAVAVAPSDAGSSVDATDEANVPPVDDGGMVDATDDDATSGGDATTDALTVNPGVAVAPTSKLNVSALAIHPEGTHVYFGATNAKYIGVLDLDAVHGTFVPGVVGAGLPLGSAELHAGAGGATRIRLSVDPFAYSKAHDLKDPTRPEYGRFVAGAHDNQPDDPLEFLYVIARDGSVRVLDVAEGKGLTECDFGIDPNDPNAQALGSDDSPRKACFPYPAQAVTDPTVPPPRRLSPGSSPGQRFASTPQDIAFANYFTPPPPAESVDPNVTETALSGAFAFVMTTTGAVYILNIDPELRKTKQIKLIKKSDMADCTSAARNGGYRDVNPDPSAMDPNGYCAARFEESPRPLTHSFRDANVVSYSTGLGPQNGPPRLDTPPIPPVTGPSLQSFLTWDSSINPLAMPYVTTAWAVGVAEKLTVPPTPSGPSTYVYFPNRYTVTAQAWAITWEGDLTGVRYTGDLKKTTDQLTDNGSGFCGLGATDGDVVTLIGCSDTTNCAPGTVCVLGEGVPASVDGRSISGLCIDQNNVTNMTRECGDLLKTFRRYEIRASSDKALTIQPKKDEVPRPVFIYNQKRVTCLVDQDCRPEMDTVHANFTCESVNAPPCDPADRACAPTQRCLQHCGGASDMPCRQGRVCVHFPEDQDKDSYCAEAPFVDPKCFPQLVSYKLSAGNAFVVSGSAVGRVETIVETPGPMGPSCNVPVSTAPPSVARIRMNTAPCDPPIDLADPKQPDPKQPGHLKDTAVVANSPTGNSCFMIQACPTNTKTGDDCTAGAALSPCTLTDSTDKNLSQVCTCPAPASSPSPTWTCVKSTSAVPGISAFFENHEFRFVLSGLEQPVANTFQIRFDVHGGLGLQLVGSSPDANPGLPARILLGPIPQPDQTIAGPPLLSDGTMPPVDQRISDLPYLFVVDQRQFSGGRLGPRGQILRITPRVSATVPVSQFEGFAAGGQYFPLQ